MWGHQIKPSQQYEIVIEAVFQNPFCCFEPSDCVLQSIILVSSRKWTTFSIPNTLWSQGGRYTEVLLCVHDVCVCLFFSVLHDNLLFWAGGQSVSVTVKPVSYEIKIQWNLRAKDTLGPTVVSIVERMSFSRRFQNASLQWEYSGTSEQRTFWDQPSCPL